MKASYSSVGCATWAVEEEDSDLLIKLLPDIHRPMNTGTRLFALDLTGRDLDGKRVTTIAVLNREEIASQDTATL